jgi:hypothetical protein
LSAALLLAAHSAAAQETFEIRNASREYDLVVSAEGCGEEKQHNSDTCNGKARVGIYRKGAKSSFQVINLPNVEIYKDALAYNPKTSVKPRGLYEEEYSFIFDDFDFDGRQDLAICNGRNGGYGGPSYDVYLFDKRSGRFVGNKRLSKLTEGVYLGLFFPDPKKKVLVTYSKSGCCYHEQEVYRVVNNGPVMIEKVIEDATGDDGQIMKVTTRKLVNGKWIERVKKERISEENQE